MSKFLGFLLGIAVAVALPAGFGGLIAEGGVELNAKEMALAYGIGALVFWAVVSYFSGAAALGAALTFGLMIYAVHWIPNRTTNFLNDVPGVTTGMIDGLRVYVLNGVVPILAVISLVYAIQLIVRAVQRRRARRVEAERLQREQEAAQAAELAGAYPAAAAAESDYAENQYSNFGNTSYDDLFDEEPEPEPARPRSQADEQTMQFAPADAQVASGNDADDTVLVPSDRDETVTVPVAEGARDEWAADGSVPDDVEQEEESHAGTDEGAVSQTAVAGQGAGEPVARSVEDDDADGTASQPVNDAGSPAEQEPVGAVAGQAEAAEAGAPERGAAGSDEDRPEAGAASGGGSGQPGQAQAASMQAPQEQPVQPVEEQVSQVPPAQEQPSTASTGYSPAQGSADRGVQASAGQSSRQRVQDVGQQYRERMEGFNPEDTGEFHLPAFERPGAPMEDRPYAGPRIMNASRPAGA